MYFRSCPWQVNVNTTLPCIFVPVLCLWMLVHIGYYHVCACIVCFCFRQVNVMALLLLRSNTLQQMPIQRWWWNNQIVCKRMSVLYWGGSANSVNASTRALCCNSSVYMNNAAFGVVRCRIYLFNNDGAFLYAVSASLITLLDF